MLCTWGSSNSSRKRIGGLKANCWFWNSDCLWTLSMKPIRSSDTTTKGEVDRLQFFELISDRPGSIENLNVFGTRRKFSPIFSIILTQKLHTISERQSDSNFFDLFSSTELYGKWRQYLFTRNMIHHTNFISTVLFYSLISWLMGLEIVWEQNDQVEL